MTTYAQARAIPHAWEFDDRRRRAATARARAMRALGLPHTWAAACGEPWHWDSYHQRGYGLCAQPRGHTGNHLSAAGTEWRQDGSTVPLAERRRGGLPRKRPPRATP